MKQYRLSQEGLKLIACVTMLLDHIGATLVLDLLPHATSHDQWQQWVDFYYALRILGRIAFPIYCFLLVEGAAHTRSPQKYALRLAVGAALSEIPFCLAFSDGFQWEGCSVMVTLLLGFLMLQGMERTKGFWKLLWILPAYLLAEWLNTDYSGHGILLIAMLALTRGLPHETLLRLLGFSVLLWFGGTISIAGMQIPLEIFGVLSLIPIFFYGGHKRTSSKAVQWGFYLFYPVHLTLLWALDCLIFG